MVSKREYDLVHPEEDKIVLGDTIAALTEKQAALQKSIEKQKDVTASVEEVRGSISALTGAVRTAKQDVSVLGDKVQVLESGSSDVQTMLQGINNSITALERKDSGLADDIQEDRERLQELEQLSLQVAESMQGILTRLDALEKPDTGLEEKLQGILDRLDALEGGA